MAVFVGNVQNKINKWHKMQLVFLLKKCSFLGEKWHTHITGRPFFGIGGGHFENIYTIVFLTLCTFKMQLMFLFTKCSFLGEVAKRILQDGHLGIGGGNF